MWQVFSVWDDFQFTRKLLGSRKTCMPDSATVVAAVAAGALTCGGSGGAWFRGLLDKDYACVCEEARHTLAVVEP